MKKLILACGIIIASLLLMSLAFASEPSLNNTYSQCIKSCTIAGKINHFNCLNNYKNESLSCKQELKQCKENIEKIDKKNISQNTRTCNINNSGCIKNYQIKRNLCNKNASSEEKNCKENCKLQRACPSVYSPICGKNNVTYSNECELKKSGAERDCKGQCPCKNKSIAEFCITEGNTIPLVQNPPSCCKGLKTIMPKDNLTLGISGICTNKCGDKVCDNNSESEYNCPQDCLFVMNLCENDNRDCLTIFEPRANH